MDPNPFLSETFKRYWKKHFLKGAIAGQLAPFTHLEFVKKPLRPICYNLGQTQTKGIPLQLTEGPVEGVKNKVFVIYDVPSYDTSSPALPPHLGLRMLTSVQYPGYLCDLKGFKDLDAYLNHTLSKRSRRNLSYYENKLNKTLQISYQMHLSDIDKGTYDELFEIFRKLLVRRFDRKREYNNNLSPREWDFYHDLAYPMMLENKAGLFVTYHGDKPIALSLLFREERKLIDVIRVFDIAYAQYRIGTQSILALLKWCFRHNIEQLDFSKGEFEYKKRWANTPYHFNYHILYDPGSIYLRFLAYLIFTRFELKQFLRKVNFDHYFNRLKFYLQEKRLK